MLKLRYLALVFTLGLPLVSCGGGGGESIEDFRLEFISAGGVCSPSISDTTTSSTTKEAETSLKSLIQMEWYLDCGEGEASLSRYNSEQAARLSWWVLWSLLVGYQLTNENDVLEHYGIIKGEVRVYLPLGYTKSRAEEIANKLGGYILAGNDAELRTKILSEDVQSSTKLDVVAQACNLTDELASDGQSINVDTKGTEDSAGTAVAFAFCMLRATVAPDYIFDSIKRTRALDGRIEEEYGDYRVTWTYHPDDGLQMTLIFTG